MRRIPGKHIEFICIYVLDVMFRFVVAVRVGRSTLFILPSCIQPPYGGKHQKKKNGVMMLIK